VATQYWLMKSEPFVYSYDDLVSDTDHTTHWDGVRNYQARNMMRDDMQVGDRVLYYHSRTDPPHVVGVAEVVRAGYPDHTAFDPNEKYYDAKSDPENPRWYMVDIRAVGRLKHIVSLADLKANTNLEGMLVVRKGQRLSVQPVDGPHFDEVLRMGGGLVPLDS
jgi:predicted RNA-binding protein with PUA-like domain